MKKQQQFEIPGWATHPVLRYVVKKVVRSYYFLQRKPRPMFAVSAGTATVRHGSSTEPENQSVGPEDTPRETPAFT